MDKIPRVDYLSRDYAGLRDSMLDYASQAFPEWQPASEGDFGMLTVEQLAYMGDILSHYTDRAQMESYIGTATQRESILGLAYLIGYAPTSGSPATGTVTLHTDIGVPATTILAGTEFITGRIAALDGPIRFELNADTVIPAGGVVSGVSVVGADTVANVTEGATATFVKIAESTGAPNQSAVLPNTGPYNDTIRVFVEDANGSTVIPNGATTIKAREWLHVGHLLDADGGEYAFETSLSSRDTTSIRFGDDINGSVPPTGIQIFATYRYGVGAAGNVAVGQVSMINSRTLRGVRISVDANAVPLTGPMAGGADSESTESIRRNAPRAYRTQNRVVTEKDFRDTALGVEGVTKASVLVGTFSSVTVYVCGPDGGAPSQTLKDFVYSKFSGKLLAGTSITIASPTFIPVNFGASGNTVMVELYDQYSQTAVKANVRTAIRTYVANLKQNSRLTVGNVYDVINAVDGVQYTDIPVMARSDVAQSGTAKITPRKWEVLTVGTINLSATGGVA